MRLKIIVIHIQENMVSKSFGIKGYVVLRTYESMNYVYFAQHDSCMQTIWISPKVVFPHTFAQVMLENAYVFNVATRACHAVLFKDKHICQTSKHFADIYIYSFFLF